MHPSLPPSLSPARPRSSFIADYISSRPPSLPLSLSLIQLAKDKMSEVVFAASLLKLIPDLLKLSKVGSKAESELEYLKGLITEIQLYFKTANSMEVIDEARKQYMKGMRKLLYDAEDAIDVFIKHENPNWEGLIRPIFDTINHRNFVSKVKSIKQEKRNYGEMLDTSIKVFGDRAESSSACYQSSSIAFSDEEDNELVGIETARKQLVQWLTANSPTQKVIFVHGAQGVGKSTLAGAVLSDETVRSCFDRYVWINSSKLANVQVWDLTKEDSLESQCELQGFLQDLRSQKVRWMLVLDDAGRANVEFLQTLLKQAHPSILVTTRDSSLESESRTFLDSQVARHYKHVCLPKDDSVKLFWKKTPRMDAVEHATASILEQCEGLPIVILAASELLRGIQGRVNGRASNVEWTELSGSLGKELLSNGNESGLIKRMITRAMDHLHGVRDCLLYLSIFPLVSAIRCSTLMRLWMAERLIEEKDINRVLQKLVNHNLFKEVEKTSYERVKTCSIYNILHQIIISKSKDDEFAVIVADEKEEWPETIWRLSFHSKVDSIKDGRKVKRLLSLFVFEKVYLDSMEELLDQVCRLKVLDIRDSFLRDFPIKILDLTYLRYLSLRDTNIVKIPVGIGNLKCLETLDLKNTLVTELPNSILQLKALRHLLVYRSNRSPPPGALPKIGGVKTPSQLGALTSVQKLCLIELNKEQQQLLVELGKLGNLRRLGISNLRLGNESDLCSSIEKLTNLEALHLISGTTNEELFFSNERIALPLLQRVHLTGRLGTLPNWILSSSLTKLFLKGSLLNEEDPLQHFKGLPYLKHLNLQQAFTNVMVMNFEEGGFKELLFFGLDTFPSLVSITIAENALPALKRLYLGRCKELTRVPEGITHPRQLICLEFYNMPEAFVTAVQGHGAIRADRKIWINGVVVEGYPMDPITTHPGSSRRGIPSTK